MVWYVHEVAETKGASARAARMNTRCIIDGSCSIRAPSSALFKLHFDVGLGISFGLVALRCKGSRGVCAVKVERKLRLRLLTGMIVCAGRSLYFPPHVSVNPTVRTLCRLERYSPWMLPFLHLKHMSKR